MPAPVVFIHGMFMNPLCWEKWVAHFEAAGRHVMAPAWPGHDGAPSDLRASRIPRWDASASPMSSTRSPP